MCGICGIITLDNSFVSKEPMVKKMMSAIKHRGPDDEGVFSTETLSLGFVRLSIIDLSSLGHQPFQSEDGRYIMTFNGEIFNYIELRDELISLGFDFKTNTDTEVLLKAYIAWGEKALDKLNGMWAMLVYDKKKNKIFISRDRYGIKPFYYSQHEGSLYYGSEIPAILAGVENKFEADNQIIFDYLVYNKTEHTSSTFFKGIKKLMHGHSITIDLNSSEKKIEIKKWYDIKERIKQNDGFKNEDEFKDYFVNSVKLRLRSDVPVGVCLSGGLDSSAITSIIIDELGKEDLNTFSAVFDNNFIGDESKFINLYKDKKGNRNYIHPSADILFDDLDNFIACHAEPCPTTSPYAQYKVMQLAKQNVVVTLDGQGADELLGGYHYFFGFYFKDLLKKWNIIRLIKEMYLYFKIHRSIFAFKTFIFFLLPKKIRTKVKVSNSGFFNKEFIEKYSDKNIISDNLYASESLQESLINHFEYKLEHLLKWSDRNSMNFSVESRVPFLDYRLVEKTLATPSELIIKDGMTKHLLRKSMKGVLPEIIRNRVDKIGFATPQDDWFRTEKWKLKIWEIIKSDTFANRGYFEVQKVHELFQKHLDKEINIAREIWKWIHLELWFRKYIDKKN